MGNQGKFTEKQSHKQMFIFSEFAFGEETKTVGRETPFLGLPVFLS